MKTRRERVGTSRRDRAVAEAPHRYCVPPGTGSQLRRAIVNYWSAWPEQRDAVLACYERESAIFKRLGLLRPTDAGSGDLELSQETLRAVRASGGDGAYRIGRLYWCYAHCGGPLGLELLGHLTDLGIASEREVEALASASRAEIVQRPPVRAIAGIGVQDALNGGVPGERLVAVIAGEMHGVALRDLSHFPAAAALYALLNGSDVGPEAIRRAYRAFATEFWAARHDLDSAHDDRITVLTAAPLEATLLAVSDDAGWKPRRNGPLAVYNYGDINVSVGDPTQSQISQHNRDRLEAVLDSLSEEHIPSILLLFSQWLAQRVRTGSTQKIRIHVNQVLDFRGTARHRKGDHRPEYKRQEASRILNLRDVWISGKDVVLENGRKREICLHSPLFEIALETVPDLGIIGDSERVPYAFRVAPGEWVESYLEGSSAHLGAICARLARYKARDAVERLALRVGLFLSFRWNGDPASARSEWTVEKILQRFPIPKHHPGRLRREFAEALRLLERDRIVSSVAFAPDCDERDLQGPGGHARWLKWRVIATPPLESHGILGGMETRRTPFGGVFNPPERGPMNFLDRSA